MQTGTRRGRSDSPDGDSSSTRAKRARAASPATLLLSPAPLPLSANTTSPPRFATGSTPPSMGRLSHSNGASNGDASAAGPSTISSSSNGNGFAHNDAVALVRPDGLLMYDDDKDWVADEDDAGDTIMGAEYGEEADDQAGPQSKRPAGLRGSKRMPVNREEVVRLILQGLRDIGYNTLEAESGYNLAPQPAHEFEAAVLGGRWAEALALLPQLGIRVTATNGSIPEEPVISSASSISSVKSKALAIGSGKGGQSPVDSIRFLISQQKYLEMLEMGVQKKALAVLRNELAPVAKDSEVLHSLSGFMMCMDRDDLYDRAQWDGAAGMSRRRLLEQLQTFISPSIMVPSRRLATLLDQARRYQLQSCMYHTDTEPSSLYVDHQCASGTFPTVTSHILVDHGDEVHNLAWSPDGSMLATAGQDKMVVVWQLSTAKSDAAWAFDAKPLHQLRDHRDSVGVLAWSPDGQTLATAADRSLYLWDVVTGSQKPMNMGASQHTDEISGIRWLPDGSEFIVSSMDCKVIFYTATGEMKRQWNTPTLQFRDFAITPDGARMVAVTAHIRRHMDEPKPKPCMSGRPAHDPLNGISGTVVEEFGYEEMDHGVLVIALADKRIEASLPGIGSEITSIALSADGKRFIVNVEDEDVRLYTIEPHIRLLRKFTGHVHSRYLLRSCFGSPSDRYILSGSEDGHVYVWDTTSGKPIEVLQGHADTVNAVAWNPVPGRRLFASCSDDHQIRIWQPPAVAVAGPDFSPGHAEEEIVVDTDEREVAKEVGGDEKEGLVL